MFDDTLQITKVLQSNLELYSNFWCLSLYFVSVNLAQQDVLAEGC
jgi:hypothetical protein